MSITLQIKRGLSADLPGSAPQGELYYATDTNILYIGTGTSVVELNNGVNLTLTETDVNVLNFPATQAVSGTVAVSNFPVSTQISDGTNVIGTSAHPVRTDPTGSTTQPVSGTVAISNLPSTQAISASSLPLPSGASTSAKQPALGTAGTPSADVLTVQGATSMTPLKVDGSGVTQPVSGSISISNFPGTQPISGTVSISSFPASQSVVGGGTEATALRVTIASDSTGVLSIDDNGGSLTVDGTIAATQSGTWTVQPGNTPNTSAWLTSQTPATSGGLSSTHLVSAASTNATNVKASAGQVYGWSIQNTSSSARYIKIFNKATSPTVGTDTPVLNLYIPPTSGNNFSNDTGIAFSTGIGFAITSGPTDTDSGAVSANDVVLNMFYK